MLGRLSKNQEPMSIKLSARRTSWLILFSLLAVFLAEAVHRLGALDALDQRLQDHWFQWQRQRTQAQHVVIVAIDEATLAAYPDVPLVFWTDRLAAAIARLRNAGARVIGLDMLLSLSPERWFGKMGGELQGAARDYDRPFRDEINTGKLVLVSSRNGKGASHSDYLMPSPDYLLALPDFDIPRHIGLADVVDDGFGVVRSYQVTPNGARRDASVAAGMPVLGFPSLLAIRASGLDPLASTWLLGGVQMAPGPALIPIPYIGPPGAVPQISLNQVLQADEHGDALGNLLRDKVVLIGVGSGLGDDHYTPYASHLLFGRGSLMSGVEIHANVIESLLTGYRLETLSVPTRLTALLVFSVLAAVVFRATPAWSGAGLWLLASLLLVGVGYVAFRFGTLVPIASFVVAAAIVLSSVIAWRLTGEERERSRLRQMFGRYVSNQVVTQLLQSDERLELGGKSQMLTVLFSDIRNFTTISEQLSAKEVVEMLNTYFERACAVVLAQGGSIDKFIGDAIMVEFGSPLPLPDHALRAARAAIALQGVAGEFGGWMEKRFPGRQLPHFAVGVGLHSGEAVIGNMGSSIRMEFTAIGDTVNLASRLEGLTKALGCGILVSEATVIAAGGDLVCGKTEVVQVKGRQQPVRVFELLNVKNEVRNEL